MKKLRTRHFYITLYSSLALSGLFLGWFLLFGKELAITNTVGMSDALMVLFALAAVSFLTFCFVPYFHGDRRWYSISTVWAFAFCIGSAMLWRMSGTAVGL